MPVYRPHPAPNIASLAEDLPTATGASSELVVALNGLGRNDAEVPAEAVVVPSPVNRGVAPGWNAAAGASSGAVLVFANDDVRLGPGCLDLLRESLDRNPEAGVVGPAGARWDVRHGRHQRSVDVDGLARGDAVECEAVSGFLFACRREDFERVGGFDEFFAPASWEEIDFCTALRAAGRRNYVIAGCDVGHEWGVSARQPPWRRVRHNGRSERLGAIHRRNRRHFLEKWAAHPLPDVRA